MNPPANKSRRNFLARTLAIGGASLLFDDWRLVWAGDPKNPPATLADMAVARLAQSTAASESTAAHLTESVITSLGGMTRFVKRGDVVWIKPNIGWNRRPEQAANTNPDVVSTLARLCFDAGAKKVKVGDYPCNDPRESYENSGIGPAARRVGADPVYLEKSRFRKMKIAGNRLNEHPVYPEIVECDLVINVPVAKHHSATTVTLCMKNYMGVVENRRAFHQDLPTTIADITRFMKPRLCVLDATRILTAHGPTGGDIKDVKNLNIVAAGIDIVALDAFGSELLGHKPETIGTIKMGEQYGLGKIDYRKLNLKEETLS